MNKPKYQLGLRVKKKMNKEVRASSRQAKSTPVADSTKVKPLLSRRSTQKSKKISKRTHPGTTITSEASPHFIHIEGERWAKNLTKQTQAKKVALRKHMLKKKGR